MARQRSATSAPHHRALHHTTRWGGPGAVLAIVLAGCASDAPAVQEVPSGAMTTSPGATTGAADTASESSSAAPETSGEPTGGPTGTATTTTAAPTEIASDTSEAATDTGDGTGTGQLDLDHLLVPESCGQPEREVTDGYRAHGPDGGTQEGATWIRDRAFEEDGLQDVLAPVTLQTTGNGPVTLVVMTCFAGGVSWPDYLIGYAPDGSILDAIDVVEIAGDGDRGSITSLAVTGDDLQVGYIATLGAALADEGVATLAWQDGALVRTD